MERAGNHLKPKNVWQVRTCPRHESITSSSPSKTGSGKRRLSLRSENVTAGPTATQSPSFPTEQQPGKENKLPYELQDSKRAANIRSVTTRKKSLNRATGTTDSARKVIKRRLSGDYEDESISWNKSRKGNQNKPIIFSPKVKEPEVEAGSNRRRDITPRFSIYDDQNDTDRDPRTRETRAGGNVRSNDEPAPSEIGTHTASRDCSVHMTRDPEPWRNLPRRLHIVRKSYEMCYNSRTGIAAEKESTEAQGLGTKEHDNILNPHKREFLQDSGAEFTIKLVHPSEYKRPGTWKRPGARSLSTVGRLNVPLRKGNEISPLKKRMNRLRRLEESGMVNKQVGAASVARGEHNVCNSKTGAKDLSTPLVSCLDDTIGKRKDRSAKSTMDPSTGAIKKTSRLTIPAASVGLDSKLVPLAASFSLSSAEENNHQQPNGPVEPSPTNETCNRVVEKCNAALAESENVLKIENDGAFDQQIHIDRKSIAKSTIKVSGPMDEMPFEFIYTTDYTEESIDVELARQESSHKISQAFLNRKIVTLEQRKIVVNFLISVHAYLLTSSSTLHQAIKMFDAILDIKDVSVEELQLVALGTTWITIKNMETKVPSPSKMISFAKDLYNAQGPALLCKCERKILKTLGFNIRFSDPCYIAAHYLQQLWLSLGPMASGLSTRKIVYHCACYLMDVALLEGNYSKTPSELLAAAATQTAVLLVLYAIPMEYLADHFPWNTGETTRRSYTQKEIGRVVGPLVQGVLNSAEENSLTGAVYKKYKNVKYNNTSDYLVRMIKKRSGTTIAK